MTQIFFYYNAADRLSAAAALIGKAARQKKAMLVYAPDREIASAIDRALWTQTPTGFVPHVRSDSPLAAETPIIITDDAETARQHERLLNLSAEVPPGFSRFTSLVEIIGQAEEERSAGRERVRFYKDRGYDIRLIDCAEMR